MYELEDRILGQIAEASVVGRGLFRDPFEKKMIVSISS